jgi:hypothetical protein
VDALEDTGFRYGFHVVQRWLVRLSDVRMRFEQYYPILRVIQAAQVRQSVYCVGEEGRMQFSIRQATRHHAGPKIVLTGVEEETLGIFA